GGHDDCSGPRAPVGDCVVWRRFLMNTPDTTCGNPAKNAAHAGGDAADVRRARPAPWRTDSNPRIAGRHQRIPRGNDTADAAQPPPRPAPRPRHTMTSP